MPIRAIQEMRFSHDRMFLLYIFSFENSIIETFVHRFVVQDEWIDVPSVEEYRIDVVVLVDLDGVINRWSNVFC